MGKIIIAIDGYSSCGKSTLAKALAADLGYTYIDSGAMYRAMTLYCLRKSIIADGQLKIEELMLALDSIQIEFRFDQSTNTAQTLLNGENVEQHIREMVVSQHVGLVSPIRAVRAKLIKLQRAMGEKKGVVMDGRDIGSVVFPNAELKIFMTADPDIRATRRFEELQAKGMEVNMAEVKENLTKRDLADTTRKENPLVQVADAKVIDNSFLDQQAQLNLALRFANEKISVAHS